MITIYTKSNVESYGGVAVAEGKSAIDSAKITKGYTNTQVGSK